MTAPLKNIEMICDRLEKIYDRVRSLEAEGAKNRGSKDSDLPAVMGGPILSRLESVDDALSGLRYAVWCIGETLMALHGQNGMDQIMLALEARENGARLSSWLDHRWDGVTDGKSIWCA